jgi:hypothetical protein
MPGPDAARNVHGQRRGASRVASCRSSADPADSRREMDMGALMRLIDRIAAALARRKVQRNEGNSGGR